MDPEDEKKAIEAMRTLAAFCQAQPDCHGCIFSDEHTDGWGNFSQECILYDRHYPGIWPEDYKELVEDRKGDK